MTLDRFYPIFDSADWVARMLPLGVRFFQLRIKDLTGEALATEIRAARDLAERHGAVMVVNDHWRAAIAEGCGFVHLGQEDLAAVDLPAIREAGLRLGVSTHDHGELETALAAGPDYVALGPVYPTKLKAMPWAPQGLGRIAEWKARIGAIPLVAIGGFVPDRAGPAFAAGADVVSVVTDISLNANPEARLRDWIAATRAPALEDRP